MSMRDDGEDSPHHGEWRVAEQRIYEPDSGPDLTSVIITAVAAVEDVDPTAVKEPPLYHVVDIAAVHDALFGTTPSDTQGMSGESVTFPYRGFRITVRGDGWVHVAESV